MPARVPPAAAPMSILGGGGVSPSSWAAARAVREAGDHRATASAPPRVHPEVTWQWTPKFFTGANSLLAPQSPRVEPAWPPAGTRPGTQNN